MKYFDPEEQTFRNIPKAPYYVLSNDSFMSGWGHAKNMTNTCVVPCQTWDQAVKVSEYAMFQRTDQKYVRITTRIPRTKSHVIYSLVTGWLHTSGAVK